MPRSRIGIELSPGACRVVEVAAGAFDRLDPVNTRVTSFSVATSESAALTDLLAPLRRREATVVVWGAPSGHLQVMVTQGKYDSMRAEAISSARDAGTPTDGMLADIAPGSISEEGGRRSVLVVLGAAQELSDAVQPLIEAGIRIRSLVTPADALASLARLRRALSVPDVVETYVALEETAICIALVRNGKLLAGRELAWGFEEPNGPLRAREDIAERLARDLYEFLATVGADQGSLAQVSICGGMPELRSMSVLLTEQLDIEVEPLDALFNIDAANLPDQPPDFRDRVAELRVAWAAAVERPVVINLLREPQRRARRSRVARIAIAAGVVAGLGLGWRVEKSGRLPQLLRPTARPVEAVARAVPPQGAVTSRPVEPATQARETAPGGSPVPEPSRPAASPPASPPAPIPPLQPMTSLSSIPARHQSVAGAERNASIASTPASTPKPSTSPPAAPPAAASAAPAPPVSNVPPMAAAAPVAPPGPTPPAAASTTTGASDGKRPPPVAPTPARELATTASTPVAPPSAKPSSPPPTPTQGPTVASAPSPPRLTPPIATTPAATPAPSAAALTGDPRAKAATPSERLPTVTSGGETPSPITPPTRQAPIPQGGAPSPPRPSVPPTELVDARAGGRENAVSPDAAPRASRAPAPPVAPSPPPDAASAPALAPSLAPAPEAASARQPAAQRAQPDRTFVQPPSVRPRQADRRTEAPPLPFEAVLQTILYSPDRQLAIVDGRIIAIGDSVKGARVVEITSTVVLLRDEQGRLRRLALGSP